MIIWGWKSRSKTLREGVFFSPAAGRDAPYRVKEARTWFTLFFIPIIPLKVLGIFVECQTTGATYDLAVLDRPTNAAFSEQLAGAAREIVAAMAVADGHVTRARRDVALSTIGQFIDGYDDEALDGDLERAATAPLADRLAYLSDTLNEHGKERLLTAAASMLGADGSVDDRHRGMVRSIGEQLAMSPAHVHGVIDTAVSERAHQ